MFKRGYIRLYKYIIGEVLASFFVAFLFFFFIFFVNYILLMAEKILSKHVPFFDVVTLLICYLPQIISLSLPFSALVGALMAIGRFSSDNEILAFRASGISIMRLFMPVFALSFIFSFVSFLFNDYFLPLGFIQGNIIQKTLFSKNPGLELEPYMAKSYEEKVIITGNVDNNRIINDVIIIDRAEENQKRIITAKTARLLMNKAQEGVISLELEDVFSHQTDGENKTEYEYSYAEEMVYNILIQNILSSVTIQPTAREMTSFDVWKSIVEKQSVIRERRKAQDDKIRKQLYDLTMEIKMVQEKIKGTTSALSEGERNIERELEELKKEQAKEISDQSIRMYLLEFHKKFSHPFSCVFFIIFAFPVGLFARRSGKMLGFGIGVLMSGFYWGMLFVSYRTGYRVDLPPFVMIWFPNLVVLIAGLGMFLVRFKR